MREKFNSGWQFHKGHIPIRYAVKAGMTGGLTDTNVRENGVWLDIAFVDEAMDHTYKAEEWKDVDIPHDWCIEGDFIFDNKLGARIASSGYLPVGTGCYRKVFDLSDSDLGKKIFIEFDGIMRKSTVLVNGHLMGTHFSGYTSFYYDITDVVRYGKEGSNIIFVRVEATDYEGWWYDGCGIYRHVWLSKVDRLCVGHWGTYVTTPRVSEAEAVVSIETKVVNEYKENKEFQLVSSILDADGKVVASVSVTSELLFFDSNVFKQEIAVTRPVLWSPEQPYIYNMLTEIKIENVVVDTYSTTFGIRTIEFTSDRGFFLNGKHTVIKGVCCHQDFAGLGVALPDSIIEYKLRLLKEMGCNAYRSAHHTATEVLDICDRLGIMVMDENRKLDSSPQGITDLKSMLYQDRNHPSIIMWSMENEEILEGTEMGARILDTMVKTVHKIDPTRPTVAAMNHGWNDGDYSDAVDIVGYNYGQRDGQDVNDHKLYPSRIMIGSESASCTTTRGIYEADFVRGYCNEYGNLMPEWGCTPEKAWQDVVDNPFLTGIFVWTGFDYRGEPTPFEWPCVVSHFGIMDLCGFPKDRYYYYKSVWTEGPTLHILPHWNFPEKEGKEIDVWAYSNCETVELYVNGVSHGKKEVYRNSHLEWKVRYVPGELKAVGIRKDGSKVEKTISTTGHLAKIKLDPDRSMIFADGYDATVVRVSVLDEYDRVIPTADAEILFSIDGPGKIIGVGNGNPSSHEHDKSNIRRTFNGYCLVIVQAGKEPGNIRLKAVSTGLPQKEITVVTK